jgi:hypothetical protein
MANAQVRKHAPNANGNNFSSLHIAQMWCAIAKFVIGCR